MMTMPNQFKDNFVMIIVHIIMITNISTVFQKKINVIILINIIKHLLILQNVKKNVYFTDIMVKRYVLMIANKKNIK